MLSSRSWTAQYNGSEITTDITCGYWVICRVAACVLAVRWIHSRDDRDAINIPPGHISDPE